MYYTLRNKTCSNCCHSERVSSCRFDSQTHGMHRLRLEYNIFLLFANWNKKLHALQRLVNVFLPTHAATTVPRSSLLLISVPHFSPTDKLFISSVPRCTLVPFITGSSTIWSCSVPSFRRSATCSVPRFSLHQFLELTFAIAEK